MQKTLTRKIPAWLGFVLPAVFGLALLTLGLGGPRGIIEYFEAIGGTPNYLRQDAPATPQAPQPRAALAQSAAPAAGNAR